MNPSFIVLIICCSHHEEHLVNHYWRWIIIDCESLLTVHHYWLWIIIDCESLLTVNHYWLWNIIDCESSLSRFTWLTYWFILIHFPSFIKKEWNKLCCVLQPESWKYTAWKMYCISLYLTAQNDVEMQSLVQQQKVQQAC